ncbi:leucine-rich repeat domain-containing protein [Chryseobacterium oryctis]|uniref:Leucine-rich repeat domain-containing protein n=1 Tax=Chryseobacterium oryctis TaxID=2952618 RepID=A0ABT3HP39_9FLAO|nr:leucine-rich repeat domain-containing protein [Chryseobacterium oryctis]MCW3161519.1 leucine-rich repeat domain-containing protein [Chryseobacterium oryctis]
MMNNKFLWLVLLFPLLYSCQKYNNSPFDEKEKFLRQFPIEDTKTMVLDSLWDKRDSLTYLRLKNLRTIAMNEVNYIPNWIGEFNKVRIFLVVNEKNKKINKIPLTIGKLSNLVQFDIKNNMVSMLPNSFYDLTSLTYLDLRNNPIISIDNKISHFVNLESIRLDNTLISNLHIDFCKLQKLETLVLENTKIKELPSCLGNLQNLDWLNVSGTQLTEFPLEILNAPKLETIDARRLKLKNYKEVKAICNEKNISFHYDE